MLTLGLVGLSIFALPDARAHACSVMAGWPPSESALAAESSLVFAGTVESVIQDKSVYGDYRITFAVEESLKGQVGETVTVRAPGSSAACGYDAGNETFTKGSAWVIYATGDATEGFSTNAIGLNKKYDSVDAAVTALKAINATPVVPQEDLWVGKRGVSVTWLQQKLISLNAGAQAQALAATGATGYFGAQTKAALVEYQTAHGITPAAGYFGAKTRSAMSVAPAQPAPENGPLTVEGATTCLPPKDPSKPTILMCALGLKATDGTYYALSYENVEDSMGVEGNVRVEGTFTRESHDTWNSVGIIKVEDIDKI